MFKIKNILSTVAALFGFPSYPTLYPKFLSLGTPNKFNQSRFPGVARAKREARKLRNRRRSRAH